jgi:protein-disulfide reductase (glutathione)
MLANTLASSAMSAMPSATPAQAPTAAKASEPTRPGAIEWQGSVDWHSYQQGVELAKQSHKPILLMVYADWCSKCRALVPVFERSDVRELTAKMVAVRHNHDDPAPWLSEIGAEGKYVPRIIFLNSDGVPLRQVTSGNPRYPLFYMAEQPDTLVSSMKQVLSI